MTDDKNDNNKELHVSVMPEEVLEYLIPDDNKAYRIIDGTLGYGGHSSLILKKNRLTEVLGIDRDAEALSCARKVTSFASDRIHLYRGDFSNLLGFAEESGWDSVDGILLDLGVSSPQIEGELRGFSHRLNGPLDMRMDKRSPITASRVLNKYTEAELARIFWEYGEIRKSRQLAKEIVSRREKAPWTMTGELKELCEKMFGPSRPGKLPASTLCFQALRIEVNQELEELKDALEDGLELLAPGGRFAIISFHSLEDRIVKNFFREAARDCICPPKLPVCRCEHSKRLNIITKKVIRPSEEEIKNNRRASSSKLRVAEKVR